MTLKYNRILISVMLTECKITEIFAIANVAVQYVRIRNREDMDRANVVRGLFGGRGEYVGSQVGCVAAWKAVGVGGGLRESQLGVAGGYGGRLGL